MAPYLAIRDDGDSDSSGDDKKGGGGGHAGLWFLFFLVLVAAGVGYFFWWRSQRRHAGYQLHNLGGSSRTLRLSNDGPPADEFISNNSTDSLPALAAGDVPFLPEAEEQAEAAAAALGRPQRLHKQYTDAPEDERSGARSRSLDPLGAVPSRSEDASPAKHDDGEDANPNHVFSLDDDDDDEEEDAGNK